MTARTLYAAMIATLVCQCLMLHGSGFTDRSCMPEASAAQALHARGDHHEAEADRTDAARVGIIWVDRYARRMLRDEVPFASRDAHEEIDLFTRLTVGVAVQHDERPLGIRKRTGIASSISWHAQWALRMERITEEGPVPVKLSPPFSELFNVLLGLPRIGNQKTIRDDEHSWLTFGRTSLTAVGKLPPGWYRVRFIEGGVRGADLETDTRWHYFELLAEEQPEGSVPGDRLPWRDLP